MKQFVREYAINCPICEKAPVADVRTLWFLHGFMRGFSFVAQYGSQTIIGCVACVRRESIKAIKMNAFGGWWCWWYPPWGYFTPFVVLQNILEMRRSRSTKRMDVVLKKAGIDPNDVQLDSEGFTREQRRLVDAASYILATAMWADGQATPEEHARALAILKQLIGRDLRPEEAAARVKAGREWTGRLIDLPFEVRQTLLRMALDITLVDGSLAPSEILILHTVAERLGFATRSVEELLEEVLGRTSSSDADDVSKAALILGVTSTASLIEVKNAWRQAMLKYHPDRAGGDPACQQEFTVRSQEINWANDVLQRHATATTQI